MHAIVCVLIGLATTGSARRAHTRVEFTDAELAFLNLKDAVTDPSMMKDMSGGLRHQEAETELVKMIANPRFQEQAKRVADNMKASGVLSDLLRPEAYAKKHDSSNMLQSLLLALNPAAATRSNSVQTQSERTQVNALDELALSSGADALQMGPRSRPVVREQRAISPLLQLPEFPKLPDFGVPKLPDFGGGEKEPAPPPQDEKEEDAKSPELQLPQFPKLPDFGVPKLPDFGGGEKKPAPPPQDEEEEEEQEQVDARSPERKRFEEEETGFLFFQGATPLTGQQDDLPEFLSKEDLSTSDDSDVLKATIFGGITLLGLLVLLVILFTS